MTNSEINLIAIGSCRICLNYNSYNWEIQGKQQQLFEDCLGESVFNGSTVLCFDCAKKLEDFNQFKLNAAKVNQLWNSRVYLLKKVEVKDENGTDSEKHQIDQCLDQKDDAAMYDDNDSLGSSTEEKSSVTIVLKQKRIYERKKKSKKKSFKNKCKPLVDIKLESKYECGLCNIPVVDKLEAINNHVAEHFENNLLECQLCDFKGYDFADMESHRFVHQPHIKRIWCHVCNENTISKEILTFHFRIKHISKNNVCACRYCNRTYTNYKRWKLHLKFHTECNERKYKCDICNKQFIEKYRLRAHMIETHLKNDLCVCYICGEKVGRRYLKTHIRMTHQPGQGIKCSHCNKTYKSQAHLDIHQARIKKIFTCPHCPKIFHDNSYRNRHILFHSELRPFRCNLCDSSYKVKSSLVVHMRKHTGERPFVCSTCGKGFASGTLLKRHMGMHSGKRVKQCSNCDRSFHSNALLNAHIIKAHAHVGQK